MLNKKIIIPTLSLYVYLALKRYFVYVQDKLHPQIFISTLHPWINELHYGQKWTWELRQSLGMKWGLCKVIIQQSKHVCTLGRIWAHNVTKTKSRRQAIKTLHYVLPAVTVERYFSSQLDTSFSLLLFFFLISQQLM